MWRNVSDFGSKYRFRDNCRFENKILLSVFDFSSYWCQNECKMNTKCVDSDASDASDAC